MGNREIKPAGWREWISFPALGIPAIKAKLDTGARTSAIHAFAVEPFRRNGMEKVRFGIHPIQRRADIEIFCEADVIDQRMVSDSGGHREMRYVIRTPVRMGDDEWSIEVTLTNRDTMLFRVLFGRTAMRGRMIIDPGASYLTGSALKRSFMKSLKGVQNR